MKIVLLQVCVPCELENSNVAFFFKIFISSAFYSNKYDNILEETHGTYVT